MKILFVNACVRKESRTLRLCNYYMEIARRRDPFEDCDIETVNLQNIKLQPLSEMSLISRAQDVENRAFESPVYDAAKIFASADIILIGAPYWDLSFPAALKVYFENICVNQLTFYYDSQGMPRSLCNADKVIYITTAGGYIGEHDSGAFYVKDLCSSLFGIDDFHVIAAEGLDIEGNDPEAILTEALKKIDNSPELFW